MAYSDAKKEKIKQLQKKADDKLLEIKKMLSPEQNASELLNYDAAWDYYANSPPLQQRVLRLKTIVAYAELQKIISEMQEYINEIGGELNKTQQRNKALQSYVSSIIGKDKMVVEKKI